MWGQNISIVHSSGVKSERKAKDEEAGKIHISFHSKFWSKFKEIQEILVVGFFFHQIVYLKPLMVAA